MDGVAHIKVPGFDVWCLSDGAHVFGADVFPSVASDTLDQRLAAAGNRVLESYQSKLVRVDDGDTIVPDVTAWALPGHTAGHMGLRIGDTLVLCGDILHSDALQLPDPDVASIYDDDAHQARQTRLEALNEIATRDLIFSGSHGSQTDKFRKLVRDVDCLRTRAV